MKNLVYFCAFCNSGYGDLLVLLLESLRSKGSLNPDTTDLLLITSPNMVNDIVQKISTLKFSLNILTLDIYDILNAACARLLIFKIANLEKYDKLLYLDTDILINSNINKILDLPIEDDKLYVGVEMTLDSYYHGKQFYSNPPQVDLTQPAFSSSVLYFKNSPKMKELFYAIQQHIYQDVVVNRNQPPGCLDQPYIVYNAAIRNMYNPTLIDQYIAGIGGLEEVADDRIVIYHFKGSLGNSQNKKQRMETFISRHKPVLNETS
jgi:alpha-N-acetylglucosamine transferase